MPPQVRIVFHDHGWRPGFDRPRDAPLGSLMEEVLAERVRRGIRGTVLHFRTSGANPGIRRGIIIAPHDMPESLGMLAIVSRFFVDVEHEEGSLTFSEDSGSLLPAIAEESSDFESAEEEHEVSG